MRNLNTVWTSKCPLTKLSILFAKIILIRIIPVTGNRVFLPNGVLDYVRKDSTTTLADILLNHTLWRALLQLRTVLSLKFCSFWNRHQQEALREHKPPPRLIWGTWISPTRCETIYPNFSKIVHVADILKIPWISVHAFSRNLSVRQTKRQSNHPSYQQRW